MARAGAGVTPINDDLRAEIARLLLSGLAPAQVAQRIASRGVPGGLAEAEVARAARSPYLQAAETVLAARDAQAGKLGWVLANQLKLSVDPQVPRLTGLDGDSFFERFWRANRPVVVSGLFDHWPARQWTFAALAARLGGVAVDLQQGRERAADYEVVKDRHRGRQPFAAVVDRVLGGSPSNDFYVTAYNSDHNHHALAPLWDDIGDMPGWLAPTGGRDGFFWMGPRGTITPFHHDLTNNLLLQIVGSKRVKLVPPGATPLMRNHIHCFSRWDGADLPAGPGGGDRPPVLEVTIGPGDALFLPIGWWHHVEGLEPHIGLSFTNFAADNDFYSHYRSGHGPLWD